MSTVSAWINEIFDLLSCSPHYFTSCKISAMALVKMVKLKLVSICPVLHSLLLLR